MLSGKKFVYDEIKPIKITSHYINGNFVKVKMASADNLVNKEQENNLDEFGEDILKIQNSFNQLSKGIKDDQLLEFKIESTYLFVCNDNSENKVLYSGKLTIKNNIFPYNVVFEENDIISDNITEIIHIAQIPTKVTAILYEEDAKIEKVSIYSECVPLDAEDEILIVNYVYLEDYDDPQVEIDIISF